MTLIKEIWKTFTFEAAHWLPNVPDGHPCKRVHGHSWVVELHVRGPIDEKMGWIIDFGDVKEKFSDLLKQLDHGPLNEIPGLENPTSENVAQWIWDKVSVRFKPPADWKVRHQPFPHLWKVVVQETCTSGAVIRVTDPTDHSHS